MSYVFVMVTSKTCGHCITFKQQHMKNLLANLSNIPNLNIIDISYPDRNKSILSPEKNDIVSYVADKNDNYSKSEIDRISNSKLVIYYLKGDNIVINYKIVDSIRGFPQFFLFSKDNWNDHNGNLKGLTFNGIMNSDGSVTSSKVNQPITADSLYGWVKNNMSNYNSTIMTKSQTIQQLPGYLAPTFMKLKIGSFNE